MADAQDLGSCPVRGGGSSPSSRKFKASSLGKAPHKSIQASMNLAVLLGSKTLSIYACNSWGFRMSPLIEYAVMSFTTLFVIIDPIGLIPAFVVMTQSNSVAERTHMAKIAAFTSLVILLLCMFLGQWLFKIFGITPEAFEIGGGIILFLIALDMLRARRTPVKETEEEKEEGIHKDDVAVTPLAVPMLAGPGAITTVILLTNTQNGLIYKGILAGNLILVCLLTWIILYFTAKKSSHIGVLALRVMTRLMGLVLAAISVQFVVNGLRTLHLFS